MPSLSPAIHPDAVVFACDHGHFPLALLSAQRMADLEPERRFDIVICIPDLAALPAFTPDPRIRLVEIDITSLPQTRMYRDWISAGTYFRWVLPQTFRDTYRTLFYLDTDTYQNRPGIGALFDSLDGPVPLAAVTDFQRLQRKDVKRKETTERLIADLGGKNGEYYNAGVLLIQPEPFLAMDGFARLASGIARNKAFDPIYGEQDQGAMNLAFAETIIPLSPLYNWCGREWLNAPLVAHYDPVMLHFAGPNKPWSLCDDDYIMSFATVYAEFLETHFPPFVPKPARNSSYSRLEEGKYRLAIANQLRALAFRRKYAKRMAASRSQEPGKLAHMDQLCKDARIGS